MGCLYPGRRGLRDLITRTRRITHPTLERRRSLSAQGDPGHPELVEIFCQLQSPKTGLGQTGSHRPWPGLDVLVSAQPAHANHPFVQCIHNVHTTYLVVTQSLSWLSD